MRTLSGRLIRLCYNAWVKRRFRFWQANLLAVAGSLALGTFAARAAEPWFRPERLNVSLRYESLGTNVLGVELNYPLPFAGFEALQLQAGYATNRLFAAIAPGLMPVDYGKLGLQYHFPLSEAIDPYAGLQLRFAGYGFDKGKFPELAHLGGGAVSGGLSAGCLFKLYSHLSALAEFGVNLPASFAFPYLTWAVGARYSFGD